jgi:hypothetical protein
MLAVLITLIVSGSLIWKPEEYKMAKHQEALERAINMHQPQILEIGDKELLCLPVTHQRGNSISVDYKFFVYEEGKLKQLNYAESE